MDRVASFQAAGRLVLRDCRFQTLRARNVLLKTSGSLIEGCTFYDTHMCSILVGPEFYWGEAPGVRDLVIRNNRFVNVDGSSIEIGSHPSEASRDNKNILIEGNTFEGYGARGGVGITGQRGTAIRVRNADGVTIRGNAFRPSPDAPAGAPPVIVEASRNVILTGNDGAADAVLGEAAEICNRQQAGKLSDSARTGWGRHRGRHGRSRDRHGRLRQKASHGDGHPEKDTEAAEKDTGRVEAFSDGVFAVALTLLVVSLAVPEIAANRAVDARSLLHALAAQWPQFVAFAASFFSVLLLWISHHQTFAMIRRTSRHLMLANGLLLFLVTLIPFPTAVLARYVQTPGGSVVAALYAGRVPPDHRRLRPALARGPVRAADAEKQPDGPAEAGHPAQERAGTDPLRRGRRGRLLAALSDRPDLHRPLRLLGGERRRLLMGTAYGTTPGKTVARGAVAKFRWKARRGAWIPPW